MRCASNERGSVDGWHGKCILAMSDESDKLGRPVLERQTNMSDVGAVILEMIESRLGELERDIRSSSSFDFNSIQKHEQKLTNLQSKLEKWQDDVSHQSASDQEEMRKKYHSRISGIRLKFKSIDELLSQKSRVREWAEKLSRLGRLLSVINTVITLYNTVAKFLGWPEIPKLDHLLPTPARKAIEHSSTTLHGSRGVFDQMFSNRYG